MLHLRIPALSIAVLFSSSLSESDNLAVPLVSSKVQITFCVQQLSLGQWGKKRKSQNNGETSTRLLISSRVFIELEVSCVGRRPDPDDVLVSRLN